MQMSKRSFFSSESRSSYLAAATGESISDLIYVWSAAQVGHLASDLDAHLLHDSGRTNSLHLL